MNTLKLYMPIVQLLSPQQSMNLYVLAHIRQHCLYLLNIWMIKKRKNLFVPFLFAYI